jgi:hypothetical protein
MITWKGYRQAALNGGNYHQYKTTRTMKTRVLLLAFFVSSVLIGCGSAIVDLDADSGVPQDTITEVDRNDHMEGL